MPLPKDEPPMRLEVGSEERKSKMKEWVVRGYYGTSSQTNTYSLTPLCSTGLAM
jgi:hypothetical protein